MKTLSIQQPWAWAIVHLGKVENRTWETDYRGPLLIHAGKSYTKATFDERARAIRKITGKAAPHPDQLRFGGIVGQVELVDCLWRPKRSEEKFNRWHNPGCWGWYFDKQRALPFTPVRGQLGLFDTDR